MTILSGDIVLLASQRLVDTDDGGGRITGREIISGNHNSLFPDVSDMDRAYGTVNMRKAFSGGSDGRHRHLLWRQCHGIAAAQ